MTMQRDGKQVEAAAKGRFNLTYSAFHLCA
jgi:hypothetical protein